jgi:lysine 2,3-aminomutase
LSRSHTLTIRTPADLASAGLIGASGRAALESVAARYAVAITPAMAELIDASDPDDPIARQFVPDARELDAAPEELADPIGDRAHTPVRGIVHRYPDRVLLKPVHTCPVYCRFCFRREVVGPGGAGTLTAAEMAEALGYIASRPEIWEVIVTGGDPLILATRRLRSLVGDLAAIEHVRIVRFHSRVPIVAPERVTPELVRALRTKGATTWLVVHANHPRELTPAAHEALGRLIDGGIPVLSQSVLLRGVNDEPTVLGALLRGLVEARVKPYYLHHADLAPGTAHFRTRIDDGQAIMRAVRRRHSGLCQPTYVLDLPGGHGKFPVGPSYIARERSGTSIIDHEGRPHAYPGLDECPLALATEQLA